MRDSDAIGTGNHKYGSSDDLPLNRRGVRNPRRGHNKELKSHVVDGISGTMARSVLRRCSPLEVVAVKSRARESLLFLSAKTPGN